MKSFELEQGRDDGYPNDSNDLEDEFEDEVEGLLQKNKNGAGARNKYPSSGLGDDQNGRQSIWNIAVKFLLVSILLVGSVKLLTAGSNSKVGDSVNDNLGNDTSNIHGVDSDNLDGSLGHGIEGDEQVAQQGEPNTGNDIQDIGIGSAQDSHQTSNPTTSPTIPTETAAPTDAPSSPSLPTGAKPIDSPEPLPSMPASTTEDVQSSSTANVSESQPTSSTVNTTGAPHASTQTTNATEYTSLASSRTYIYKRRGRELPDSERAELSSKYGSWNLVDDKIDTRPKTDFFKPYRNRDIPRSKFPRNAWQLDLVYVKKFLKEGLRLVDRARNAILLEYGQDATTSTMFDTILYDNNLSNVTFSKISQYSQNGWTSKRSYDNLKRRILHAIMTQDSFVFAMGGHSAAAGHGNHFQQSYTLQVAWILEPLFARLGVKHTSRNFGNGGLGTFHNAISARYLYGPDVDLLFWDSGMTEGDPDKLEMFARQAIMTPIDTDNDDENTHQKVPAIWGLPSAISSLLHDLADVDVGQIGTGLDGIKEAQSVEELESIPWAARYMRCTNDIKKDYCNPNKYNGTCWIDRPDGFVPPSEQNAVPGGRAGWHPGNREHQLTGRLITWLLLSGIRDALLEWQNAPNYTLPDSAWHVSSMYDNTRMKLAKLDPSQSNCEGFVDLNMTFLCTVPMKARSEFTPRAYAHLSNIRSIMPKEMLNNIPPPQEPIYNPPDTFNPFLHPPPGEVDVLNIVENGIEFLPVLDPPYAEEFYESSSTILKLHHEPGKGIYPNVYVGSDYCDGTLDSWCDKGADNKCMLRAHNDGRTGLLFDGFSGWLIVTIPKVKHGYILVKIEPWHAPGENPLTEGWTTINNDSDSENDLSEEHGRKRRGLDHSLTENPNPPFASLTNSSITWKAMSSNSRRLKKVKKVDYCKDFRFQYAIDDREVKSLTIASYNKIQYRTQRVVDIVTLLKEPDTWNEERDVQLAMRMVGCGRNKTFSLNHVYWA